MISLTEDVDDLDSSIFHADQPLRNLSDQSPSLTFDEKSHDLLDIVSSSTSSYHNFDGSRLASDV